MSVRNWRRLTSSMRLPLPENPLRYRCPSLPHPQPAAEMGWIAPGEAHLFWGWVGVFYLIRPTRNAAVQPGYVRKDRSH